MFQLSTEEVQYAPKDNRSCAACRGWARYRRRERFLDPGNHHAQGVLLVRFPTESAIETFKGNCAAANRTRRSLELTEPLMDLIEAHVEDLVIYGRRLIGGCDYFWRFGGKFMHQHKMLREMDTRRNLPPLDLSLGKCGNLDQIAKPFSPSYFQVEMH